MSRSFKTKSLSIPEVLLVLLAILAAWQVSPLTAGEVNRFVFSDNIGDPKDWRPGEVRVGEEIPDVVITAIDANGEKATDFNGTVYLTQQTDYGIGRISPETVHLVAGEWKGTLRVFRAGTKKSSAGVVGDVWIRASDGDSNPHFGDSPHFCARPGAFNRLLILLPGEELLPGSITGKIGQPHRQHPGADFNMDIYSTDEYWNKIKPERTQKLFISSDDTEAVFPTYVDLLEGTNSVSITVQMNTTGKTITAQDITDNTILAYTTAPISLTNETMDHFEISRIEGPVTAGQPITITVSARSVSNVLIPEFSGFVYLAASTGEGTVSPKVVGPLVSGEWSGEVTLTQAQTAVVLSVANDWTPDYTGVSNAFDVVPGELSRLQILLPGQEATPGIAPGKLGAANTQFVDHAFSLQVRATDAWWNPVQPNNLELHFTASNPEASLPANAIQNTAQASYDATFATEGQSFIIVTAVNQSVASDTSSRFYVDLGLVSRFDFSPIASPQVAGRPFTVRITAMNSSDTPVTNFNGDIIVSASTGNGTISTTGVTLTNGVWEGELFVTAASGSVTLYASDYVAPPNNHSGASAAFEVTPDTLAGLQIVLPGQVMTPGVAPGLKNEASPQVAGEEVNVLIRAVDRFWNLIPEVSDSIYISSTDHFLMGAKAIKLQNGEAQAAVRFRTAAEQRLFANFASAGLPTAQSDVAAVSPNVFARLLLLLPGENLLPGDDETDLQRTPGRSGAAVTQTAGLQFVVQVLAVDAYWNLAENVPADQVRLFITDTQALVLPATATLADGRAEFTISLTKGGNQVMRALNDSNPNIQQSPDAVVNALVGGLHYEININSTNQVAGQPFSMQVLYKNGVGDVVQSANHLVRLRAVWAATLQDAPGELEVTSFNLISGQRTFTQSFSRAGKVRFLVQDDFGTDAAYSDVLTFVAGSAAQLNLTSAKTEVGGEQETEISLTVTDAAGNPKPNKEAQFAIVSGAGSLSAPTALTDSAGVARVTFRGGRVPEVNRIRAAVDSLNTSTEVIVNLTPSTFADGEVVNYPNPFGVESPLTHIDYYLSEDANVTLKIFDLFGNLVWSAEFAAGARGGQGRSGNSHPNSVEWAGVNDRGQKVGNGGYILVAKADANGKIIMNTKRKIVVVR